MVVRGLVIIKEVEKEKGKENPEGEIAPIIGKFGPDWSRCPKENWRVPRLRWKRTLVRRSRMSEGEV